MAFHPYPRLIRKLFNVYRFGPPRCVTSGSAWPRVDHRVSRPQPPTARPVRTRFRSGSPPLWRLTLPATVTRRLIMQKARRHWTARQPAPPACRRMVSSSISPRYSRCFSPFPHGTRSLSVSQEYLALADGAAGFRGDSSGPPLLRIPPQMTIRTPTGLSPPMVCLPRHFGFNRHPLGWSYNPARALTPTVWAVPRSLAATCGITLVFFS